MTSFFRVFNSFSSNETERERESLVFGVFRLGRRRPSDQRTHIPSSPSPSSSSFLGSNLRASPPRREWWCSQPPSSSVLLFFFFLLFLDVYVTCEDWLFVILSAQILVRVIVFARGFYCSHANAPAPAGRFLMLLCFTFLTSILFMCYSFELGFFFLHLDLETYWWISLTVKKKLR